MQSRIEIVAAILGSSSVEDVTSIERTMGDGEVIELVDVYYREGTELSPDAMDRVVNALWAENLDQGNDAFPVVNFVVSNERPKAYAAE